MKDIYFCSTYYHTLIVTLKRIHNYIPYETTVVITGYIPEGDKLSARLREINLFECVVFFGKLWHADSSKEKLLHKKILVKNVEREFPLNLRTYEEYYLFMDGIWVANYFKDKHIPYHILEDGLNVFKFIDRSAFAYMVQMDNSFKSKIKRFLKIDCKYYLDCKYVKSIEVNDKNGIVLRNDPRIVEFPRKLLFENLTINDKETILQIFSEPDMTFEETEIAIIFTYPFVEDHILKSEEEQLDIYQRLIQFYKSYTVYMKPHPRDAVDYSALGIHVISKNFPSEILNFIDADRIKKYVAIETHCVDVYPKEKVEYYDLSEFISR